MIRDLFRILGPQNQGRYREFLVWAVLYGVMQGLAVALLVPAVQALFDQSWGSFVRWLAAMAVCAVISSIAHYLQAMKGFESALTLLRTMHLRLGDHLVTLPLGWFGAGLVCAWIMTFLDTVDGKLARVTVVMHDDQKLDGDGVGKAEMARQ